MVSCCTDIIHPTTHTFMKKLLLLALPALMVSCGPKKFSIEGQTVEQLDSTYAYLMTDKEEMLDSCLITKGKFAFADTVSDQKVYFVHMGNQRTIVFVENGRDITVNATEAPIKTTDNGGLNDKYTTIMDSIAKQAATLRAKENKMYKENATPDAIRDAIKVEYEKLYDYYRAEIDANKDNQVGAVLLGMTARSLYPTIAKIDSMCNIVKYAKDNAMIQSLKEQLELKEKTKEGKMFTDFRGLSDEGKVIRLSDFVGKGNYVLVDFWASWCGPCKAEIPNLVKLHKKYKDKGLTVLGINISDKLDAFRQTVKNYGIEYPQLVIPSYAKENGAKIYGINSIPHIMLIGPDGTILKRGLRGEDMMKYVEEAMSAFGK